MVHQLWRQFPTINLKLIALQKYLLSVVSLPVKPIEKKVSDLINSGGKFLRPGFFYIISEFGEPTDKKVLRSGAAAMEILHVATLIHDDVIDDSELRRGVKTIHTEYGQRNAIYAGDYLFTCYFNEILKSTTEPQNLQYQVDVMQRILSGELEQMQLRYNLEETVDQYIEEITGKTAKLFELSFKQAAILTHCSADLTTKVAKIGLTIGQAYQILDDVLDYDGNTVNTKKPILEDLKSGTYTLPLLCSLPKQKQELSMLLTKKSAMTSSDMVAVAQIVKQCGGLNDAKITAQKLTNDALGLIDELPDIKAKKQLKSLTSQLLVRNQ
ncbi:geranylgeranyl pyrophosphate synthase [Lentilactobacillus curieae]|uniref:Geranylgeranyl pyrophosphate synthase n=1 Tax=Lentilactobacillus curieae TaxID=1138822 RepID=A0A1S6QJB5_9LACO|nr:polyprenyl synthetase family protein [Lentilactobacillus curieae]AQW21695.1 geranylgeranyl pyrophosphate synthase [Lentilactobacillus curieae]